MWCIEENLDDVLVAVFCTDDLKWAVREAISYARGFALTDDEQIWIYVYWEDGDTRDRRYTINVDNNFVCYKSVTSDYVLINSREGSVFDV